jgi:hypothetical protein
MKSINFLQGSVQKQDDKNADDDDQDDADVQIALDVA